LSGGPAASPGRHGERGAQPWVEVGLAGRRPADGFDELGVGGLLQNVAERAGPHGLTRELGIVLHGENDDPRGRGGGGEARHRFERCLSARHVEIEHKHVGLVAEDGPHRAVDVAGLGQDGEAGLRLKEQAQTTAYHDVVVGKDKGDQVGLGHCHQLSWGRRRKPP
jgi:hypothetical protein